LISVHTAQPQVFDADAAVVADELDEVPTPDDAEEWVASAAPLRVCPAPEPDVEETAAEL